VRPLTHEQYSQQVKLYLTPLLGHHQFTKLAPQHVRAFMTRKLNDGLWPGTVRLSLVILRKALGQALKERLLGRNAVKLVDSPHDTAVRGCHLVARTVSGFLDAAAGERLETLYRAALAVGLRMGEALGLRCADIDLNRRALSVKRILELIGRGSKSTLLCRT
jgi:site-specific recombinase XerC